MAAKAATKKARKKKVIEFNSGIELGEPTTFKLEGTLIAFTPDEVEYALDSFRYGLQDYGIKYEIKAEEV